MTITPRLGRGRIIPAETQRRRAFVAAVIALLCLAASCEPLSEEFGEPDEQTKRDLEKCGIKKPADGLAAPPGSYVDQGQTIDYPRLIRDLPYAKQVAADPRTFEQVYADAVQGDVTARWSVCLVEAASRGAGRKVATNLAGVRCQTIARCSFEPTKLPYSDSTASGVRVLTLIADEFEAEARRLQVTQEIIGHVLTLFVGTRVLGARMRAATVSRPTVSRPAVSRPAVSRPRGKQRASPRRMRELTDDELTRVRGGSSARPGPGAAGVARAVPKPVYRPFTRANFRHNLAQRTGGIPTNAQAHHVLPVKFEPQCSKAGINIHKPKFGTWWQRGDHQRKARAYNAEWKKFFDTKSNPTSKDILQFARKIAGKYGLTIGF